MASKEIRNYLNDNKIKIRDEIVSTLGEEDFWLIVRNSILEMERKKKGGDYELRVDNFLQHISIQAKDALVGKFFNTLCEHYGKTNETSNKAYGEICRLIEKFNDTDNSGIKNTQTNKIFRYMKLMKKKYSKSRLSLKTIETLRKRKGYSPCGKTNFCELYGKTSGLCRSIRDFDKLSLDSFLLLDGLISLRMHISFLNKDKENVKNNVLSLRAYIKNFYLYIETVIYGNHIKDPANINIEETNQKVNKLLKEMAEGEVWHTRIESIMNQLYNFEIKCKDIPMFEKNEYAGNEEDWSFLGDLILAGQSILDVQEALYQNVLDRTEISCIDINRRVRQFDKKRPIDIVSWVKDRPLKSRYQEVH